MFAPQLPTLLLLLGTAVASSIPSEHRFGLLLSRQAPGSPAYECHADCGYAILGASTAGYCTNSTWLGEYDGCLECADEYDIWQYYGTDVASAGAGCGLSTVPVPSSAAATTAATTIASESMPATTAAESTAVMTSAESAATSAAPSAQTTAASAQSTADSSASAPAAASTTAPPAVGTAGSNSTSSAPGASTTVVTVSGGPPGSQIICALVGIAAVLVSGLMAAW